MSLRNDGPFVDPSRVMIFFYGDSTILSMIFNIIDNKTLGTKEMYLQGSTGVSYGKVRKKKKKLYKVS